MTKPKPANEGYQPVEKRGYQPSKPEQTRPARGGYIPEKGEGGNQGNPPKKTIAKKS